MLRIHFTSEDLARTRIAAAPDPLWEIALSMYRLAGRKGRAAFATWRQRTRYDLARTDGLRTVKRVLSPLFPHASSYFPDFLTPPDGLLGLETGVDAVLSTPRRLLSRELTKLASRTGTPSWAWGLTDGRRESFLDLRNAFHTYFDTAIAPYWSYIRATADADRAMRARAFLNGGVDHLLASFQPTMRWQSPVLTMDHPADRDVHLDGRGLLLIPSYFCWGAPVPLADPQLPQVLVYPVQRDLDPSLSLPGEPAAGRPDTPDARLLGHTRAAILRATVNGPTTGDLARRLGISPSNVSQHTHVLRDAGLITSRRFAGHVIHTITPLGESLLMGARRP